MGLDKISARLLKDSADIIAPSLQALCSKSFYEGRLPNNWKSAKFVALFKSGIELRQLQTHFTFLYSKYSNRVSSS